MPPLRINGIAIRGGMDVAGGLAFNYTGNGAKLIIEETTEWNGTIRHSAIVTFASSIDASNYFTAGGEIRFSAMLETPTTPPAYDYQTLLNKVGTVIFSNNNTTSHGIGAGTNFGFISASLAPIGGIDYIFNASNASIHEFYGGMDYGDVVFSISVTKLTDASYRFSLRYTYEQGMDVAVEYIDGTLSSMFDEKRFVSLPSPTYVQDV